MAKKTVQKKALKVPTTAADGKFAPEQRPDFQVTSGQFGEICGVHPTSVGRWVKDGLPHERDGRVTWIDLRVGIPWVRRRDREELEAQRDITNPDVAKGAKIAAEARLKELDLAEREGKLVPADRVDDTWSQMLTALREAVMDAPAVAVQAGIIEPERELELETVLRDALTAGSRRISAVADAVESSGSGGEAADDEEEPDAEDE